jgi:glycosyltransferase involved in cell wall biosynthesis
VKNFLNLKKIAIIGTVGIPANYGGFETLAEYLVKELHEKFDFTVYCSKKNYSKKESKYLTSRLVYLPIKANGKSSILYDTISIIHSLFYADILLILGVSGAFMIPIVRFFSKKKIIVNVDGLEWKRNKWGSFAKKYLKKQEYYAVKYSNIVISDNKSIQDYILKEYNSKSELIAYGGSHVNKENISKNELKKYKIKGNYYFSVCRIEPENNIHITLEAFSKTSKTIVIVGNWSSSKYGLSLKEKYKTFNNIFMFNPIYNQKQLNKLRCNCYVYIHGYSAGGTNPSLVEAMWLGLPIFALDIDYNRFTTNDKAMFYKDSESLLNLIHTMNLKSELIQIGNNLQTIATAKFNWNKISDSYRVLFRGNNLT